MLCYRAHLNSENYLYYMNLIKLKVILNILLSHRVYLSCLQHQALCKSKKLLLLGIDSGLLPISKESGSHCYRYKGKTPVQLWEQEKDPEFWLTTQTGSNTDLWLASREINRAMPSILIKDLGNKNGYFKIIQWMLVLLFAFCISIKQRFNKRKLIKMANHWKPYEKKLECIPLMKSEHISYLLWR